MIRKVMDLFLVMSKDEVILGLAIAVALNKKKQANASNNTLSFI